MNTNILWTRKQIVTALLYVLVTIMSAAPPETLAGWAPFSFDSVWYYQDGTRIVPEISRQWLTLVFQPRQDTDVNDLDFSTDADDSFIRKRAKAIVKSQPLLVGYLYDPDISKDACFLRMRKGLKLEDIRQLINRLSRAGNVKYVHPALSIDNKTFAFFNSFEMEWKTGTTEAEHESLLRAAHVKVDEWDAKGNRYFVDITAIPFFKAVNLLAQDLRVLRVTPYLVEIKPSITAKLSLYMNGGNIGDGIPFALTVSFTDRVRIDPSSIATLNLRPQEIQKELFDCSFDPYDYAKAVSKSPIVITGKLRFYAPGQFTIPSIKISYTCPSCEDSGLRSIDTDPVPFKVSSIIPAEKSETRLIVKTEAVSHDFRLDSLHRQARQYFWLSVIFAAGIVPCVAWLLLLFRRSYMQREQHRESKKSERLACQLRSLLEAAPADPDFSYLAKAGTMLREYLLELYGIDCKYKGGSAGIFMDTISGHVPAECADSLERIFAAIDDTVVIEEQQIADIGVMQSEILKVLDLTTKNRPARG